jgi:hypothetical protein
MGRLLALVVVWLVVALGMLQAAPGRPLYLPPEPPKPMPLFDLRDTTWSGMAFNMQMVVTFRRDGSLVYHGNKSVPGSWTLEGNRVYFEINKKASEHRGTILGDAIDGRSTNAVQKLNTPLSLRRMPP